MACCCPGPSHHLNQCWLILPFANEVGGGVYWFYCVHLSVCRQNRVSSVSSTILAGSSSCLHIFIKHVVAVAAYIWLASRSQAKIFKMKEIETVSVCSRSLDCFTLLLARHLADVSCYIGPSMPSGICMEIHTEIVQKRKKKPSHNKGTPRQPHVYL